MVISKQGKEEVEKTREGIRLRLVLKKEVWELPLEEVLNVRKVTF